MDVLVDVATALSGSFYYSSSFAAAVEITMVVDATSQIVKKCKKLYFILLAFFAIFGNKLPALWVKRKEFYYGKVS